MNRQTAFVGETHFLKGALHCHTTRSDGRGEPAEVIRYHQEHGYDFMALTDHRIYNYKNFSDVPMIMVPGMEMDRMQLLRKLTDIQYTRNDMDFARGTFRARGDIVDIYPAGGESAVRVELFGLPLLNILDISYMFSPPIIEVISV